MSARSPLLPGWGRDVGGRGALRRTEVIAGRELFLTLTPARRGVDKRRHIAGWHWEVTAFAGQGARVEWSGYQEGHPEAAARESLAVVPVVAQAAAVLREGRL